MGILNATPDSFSDGGKFFRKKGSHGSRPAATALCHALQMVHAGADIIDIGGESSGPGSTDVPVQEELRRIIPIIKTLYHHFIAEDDSVVISVDTYRAEVARQAIAAGARMVNDITALRGDPQMARVIAETGVEIVLMYSKDSTPRTTRVKKRYRDVVKTIAQFLEERIKFCLRAGIKRKQIIIDPGMGAFVSGDPKYSYEILRRLAEFKKLGMPILIGTSRKSFLSGAVRERLVPTLVTHAVAMMNGASIIRVHDVGEHREFLQNLGVIQ